MSEAKHTKGPWKKSERLNGPWWHISSAYFIGGSEAKSGRQAIACVHGEGKRGATAYAEMFEANARLIAASPTMYGYINQRANEGDAHAAKIIASI